MILITGAGGTVGSELVRQLGGNRPFRAGYHSEEKTAKARAGGIDAVALDFSQPETLASALAGVTGLFLLSPSQTELENNVVTEARKAGVQHVVKLSVLGAEGEAFSFAKAHRPVEKAIESSGMKYTFLRPNGFMQNVLNFFAATIKSQNAFYLPAGDARISHVDVRDIAAVALKALTESGHEGKAYDLTGPEAISYAEVAAKLSRATGRTIRYVDIPEAEFKKAMTGLGAPEAYADAMNDLFRFYSKGEASRISPAVQQVTGKPPRSFDHFAQESAPALK